MTNNHRDSAIIIWRTSTLRSLRFTVLSALRASFGRFAPCQALRAWYLASSALGASRQGSAFQPQLNASGLLLHMFLFGTILYSCFTKELFFILFDRFLAKLLLKSCHDQQPTTTGLCYYNIEDVCILNA